MLTSAAYNALCRRQRQSYFAWQAAPAGQADEAIAEYKAASDALDKAVAENLAAARAPHT